METKNRTNSSEGARTFEEIMGELTAAIQCLDVIESSVYAIPDRKDKQDLPIACSAALEFVISLLEDCQGELEDWRSCAGKNDPDPA